MRHVLACGNSDLPGGRVPFRLIGAQVGWVRPALARALGGRKWIEEDANGIRLMDPAALPGLGHTLAEEGLMRWRGEAFDVRARPDGPVLAQIDRGGLPLFGIEAVGVHVNGLVELADGLHLWVGRRGPDRPLDPNKLDHLIAGGVPAGLTPEQTLVKEAAEEASVPEELARSARRVGVVRYAMEREEGLRRDLLVCYDLLLPEDFRPRPGDDEVVGFELWPIRKVAETVRDSDEFKFNVNLVLIDLLMRRGIIAGEEAERFRGGFARNANYNGAWATNFD